MFARWQQQSRSCRDVRMCVQYTQVCSTVWQYRYAGAMSREDADTVLQHRPNGTFLIRQSINPARRGELTLSVKSVVF